MKGKMIVAGPVVVAILSKSLWLLVVGRREEDVELVLLLVTAFVWVTLNYRFLIVKDSGWDTPNNLRNTV